MRKDCFGSSPGSCRSPARRTTGKADEAGPECREAWGGGVEGDGEPAKPELKHPKPDEEGAPTPGKTNLFSVF